MEDEVKALLALVNKLQPNATNPVHSTELKQVCSSLSAPAFDRFRLVGCGLRLLAKVS
jgi:hypothetical protein